LLLIFTLTRESGWQKYREEMKVKELLVILREDGWLEKSQKGSHLQLVHPVKKGKITVPIHGGDIPKGTLHAILRQAELKQR
jgi:predicted RNA binding protein YcfA (HicA-like mRNA interferase family)